MDLFKFLQDMGLLGPQTPPGAAGTQPPSGDGTQPPVPPPPGQAPGQPPGQVPPQKLEEKKPLFNFTSPPNMTPQGGYGMYSYMTPPNPLLGSSPGSAAQNAGKDEMVNKIMKMFLLGG